MSDVDAVSIIIVSCNSRSTLTACLQSLAAAADGLPWQVILVDNASTDGSPDLAVRMMPEAVVIRNAKNTGFAAACNLGASKAVGEWLLFLNPDVILDSGSVRALIEAMKCEPKAGLATMRLRSPDGSFQANCRYLPSAKNLIFSRGSVASRVRGEKAQNQTSYTLPEYFEVTRVAAVSATAMAVRRDLFLTVQGFDERYFLFMEDTDLSRRLAAVGYVNLFVPQAGAVHGWGKGSGRGNIARAWYHHISVWRYFRKYEPTCFSRLLLPFMLLANFVLISLLPSRRK